MFRWIALRDESRPLLIWTSTFAAAAWLEGSEWQTERARILVGCEPFYQPVLVDFAA